MNLVNPTAGIFDDDHIALEVAVEAGSSLVLTTPASSRVYRSRNGSEAQVTQDFHVESGAFLEYVPEPFIPHAGARYAQWNRIHVARNGVLLFFEWLAPGRVASGESFLYKELRWDTDIWLGEGLIARERYALDPANDSLSSLRLVSDTAHYIGCFVLGLETMPIDAVHALAGQEVYIGCGPLPAGGWTIKAICQDALAARRTMTQLRVLLYQALGRTPATLGRF